MPSFASKLLSIMGLTGSGLTSNSLIPPSQTPDSLLRDFDKSGELANPDVWSAYNSATARPRTLDEQLRNWDEAAHWDLMAAALSEIVEECTQVDVSSPGALWYECSDKKVEEELNAMLQDVGVEDVIKSQVWNIAAFGNNFEKLEYAPGEGVKGFNPVHVMDIKRYWLLRNRRCVGFRWKDNLPNKEAIFELPGIGKIERAGIKTSSSSANADMELLWYPWDIMHMRRMYKSRQTEHGEPLYEEAMGIYRKLRLAIDQMVVHRAQVQPDRYAINIDVKDQVPIDQMKTVNRWKQSMRSKLSFGSGISGVTGQPDDFKSFYSAMALDTILWIAKPRDFQHGIEKLPGTASVPDVQDIELLTNLFFSVLGMPKSWIGLGDKEGAPASGKALLAQDMRFLRKIKSLRAPILNSYNWLGHFHCLLKGVDVSSTEVRAVMSPIGSLEDNLKLELLKNQADILSAMADIMPKYGLPKEAWIDLVFKTYLRLPDDIVDTFLTALPDEAKSGEEGPGPLESSRKRYAKKAVIAEEIVKRLGPERQHIINNFADILDGKTPRVKNRYRTAEQVLNRAIVQENDVISTGFGQLDPMNEFKPLGEHQEVTEKFTSHPGFTGKTRQVLDLHLKK